MRAEAQALAREAEIARKRLEAIASEQRSWIETRERTATQTATLEQRLTEAQTAGRDISVVLIVADHPLLTVREDVRRVAVIVNTADRGLAGAYNANVLKAAERTIREEEGQGRQVDLYVVGRKGAGYFAYRGRAAVGRYDGFSDEPTLEDVFMAFYSDAGPAAQVSAPARPDLDAR